MAYSIKASSNGCYEGTTCLINKLGIRDEALLAQTESAYTFARASYLELHPLVGDFDLAHYQSIHRFLFSDLYEWAGELRQVDLSKRGTVFVPAMDIERCANAYFLRASRIDFFALSRREAAAELADLYSTLNMIHPFREGNGRVQRIFFRQWVSHLGFDIDFTDIDTDRFMVATIYAAQDIIDDLVDIFDQLLEPAQSLNMDLTF